MVNVAKELKKLGIEISDEQKESLKKSMGEELYSKEETEDILKERDDWKRQAEDSKKDYEC